METLEHRLDNAFNRRYILLAALTLVCWLPIALQSAAGMATHIGASSFVVLVLYSGIAWLALYFNPWGLAVIPVVALLAWSPGSEPPARTVVEHLMGWQKYAWSVLAILVWIRYLNGQKQAESE